MSLFKQLLIAICLFLVVAFSGSFMVSLESSRAQYVNQLRSHAQDAATALALSLTPNIDDPAMVELMVSSIFDSGYYASIRVVDVATDKTLVERTGTPDAGSVPQWFVKLIGLEPAGGDAIVSRGWEQAARVEVVSHPMFALAKLWQSALGSLGWLLLCGAVSAVLGALLLRRQLKPLDYMVHQSHAIARREFLSLPELPRTPELRRVVQAMNQMVEKLKALFQEQAERSEKLRVESYQDNLTGLANRRYFEMQLNARVSNPEQASSGYLLLLRVKDLAGLNQRLGGQRTDQLLQAVGEQLLRECARYPETHNLVTRIRGGEFAVLAPGLVREEALQLAQNLEAALASLHATGATDVASVASIGLAPFVHGDSPQAVLQLGDQALAQAESQGEPGWACLDHSAVASVGDDHHAWHTLLDQALNHQRFELYFQPVVAAQDTQVVLHYKVLSRLLDEHGQTIPAGRFLPWLERFGWTARLDRLMLEQVLRQMAGHEQSLALNLSSATLADPQALNKIFEILRAHSNLGSRLTLEIGEEQLPEQAVLEQLTRRLRELGFSLSLQRFGGRFSMIGNLSRLGLAYLKIDGSYIRAIDQESDKRLFIEAIQRAAHSIDLPLIAERVETEGELAVIREMGLFGVQGQLVGEPKRWG
ncbi:MULTISPECIES: cyclic di-GMP receptor LapD [Pseudomonas]|uniref:Putative diguanylate cyclase/phosphodiesterase n=1 Tax=Pseudomonas brassicacearum (strain NFM421) TaxID=994484 RepID=F2KD74_PSEBN|nr:MULTISPECIES: EAL domain-containing protein [Pseudomonas]EIK70272.1 cyclic dimeric GMP binding protein LapD [Pseudomonas fluorescens Q8r1-96]KIR15005.1 RNase E specificity factor CsrD [Pseudomonas fluorescens]AEA66336.1 Putative diguanylate cyclase/phosphodiesterase [Pseudomonas brassicacearum subsp. brassicacearum NFM421]ALQ00769.1 Membrane bound c-di-GMP receptor LapD [Pseudomonas brassicacearum]KAB0517975.1 EAL domain-containing protein [Pseudomonas brassicacearum subsp. brassicacearum]